MKNKKMPIKAIIFLSLLLALGLFILIFIMINTIEQTKQVQVPFSYDQAGDLDPMALTTNIMQAIGYPDAIPFLTREDRFRAVLYNRPTMQNDLEFHTMTSTFRFKVNSADKSKIVAYEFQLSQQKDHLILINRNEDPNESYLVEKPVPDDAFALSQLLSALRDFPAESYREHTEYGSEEADLYSIDFNFDGRLLAENFYYNNHGYLKEDDTVPHDNKASYLISHLNWGDIRDASLPYDDPRRYSTIKGIGRANLLHIQKQEL